MARPAKLNDEVLLTRTLSVFREAGYASASLTRLADATELKRASLYHRFPGGKEEIALETIGALKRWINAQIIAPLKRPGVPEVRLQTAADAFVVLYDHGREACIMNLFGSSNSVPSALVEKIQAILSSIISAISGVLEEAGLPDDEARARAMKAVATVEGAVVMARSFRDTAPFDACMAGWAQSLLEHHGESFSGQKRAAALADPDNGIAASSSRLHAVPSSSQGHHPLASNVKKPAVNDAAPMGEVRRAVARHLASQQIASAG